MSHCVVIEYRDLAGIACIPKARYRDGDYAQVSGICLELRDSFSNRLFQSFNRERSLALHGDAQTAKLKLNIRPLVKNGNKTAFRHPAAHDELEHEISATVVLPRLKIEIGRTIKSLLYLNGEKISTDNGAQR